MRIIDSFVLNPLGEEILAIPVGTAAEKIHGIIRLNSTGADIFQGIQQGLSLEKIAQNLVQDYEGIDLPQALQHIQNLVEKLKREGVIEE